MQIVLFILILIFSALHIYCQDFKSVPAKNAYSKYNTELRKVEEIKLAAEKQFKKDLAEAINTALKDGDLDEANHIKAVIDGKVKLKEDMPISKNENQAKGDKTNAAIEIPREKEVILNPTGEILSDKHIGIVKQLQNQNEVKYHLRFKKIEGKRVKLLVEGEYENFRDKAILGLYLNAGISGYHPILKDRKKGLENKEFYTMTFDLNNRGIVEELKDYEITFKLLVDIKIQNAEVKITGVKIVYEDDPLFKVIKDEVLSDKHLGQISKSQKLENEKYKLKIKKVPGKNVILNINGDFNFKNLVINFGVLVNGVQVGVWQNKKAKEDIKEIDFNNIKFDITDYVQVEELKDYEITFSCLSPIDVFVSEVNVEYK